MTDREKVINELVEHIESALNVDSDYVDCVRTDLLQYTVAMLKEQEATIEILVKDITFHNCNNCNRKDCENKPNAGQPVRSNCIFWLESR